MHTLKKKEDLSNLTRHLKESEKEQTKPKTGRRKKIIKIKAEIKEIGKFSETKSQFFEKINKIDKLQLRGKKERRLKLLKSENKSGDITTGYIETEGTIRE